MTDVIVLIGAGSIGIAIARRVSAGKHLLVANLRVENAEAGARTLRDAGVDVTTATVDVSSRNSVQALRSLAGWCSTRAVAKCRTTSNFNDLCGRIFSLRILTRGHISGEYICSVLAESWWCCGLTDRRI